MAQDYLKRAENIPKWNEERFDRMKKVICDEVHGYIEDGLKDKEYHKRCPFASEGIAALMADALTVLSMNLSFVCGFYCDLNNVPVRRYPEQLEKIFDSIKNSMAEDYKETIIKTIIGEQHKEGGDSK
ncbi:MAG: hypothetical protein WC208_10350 [Gallionella sp.]|jgi:hypothetical protein